MKEVMKRADHYVFITSTAEVTSTDDFVVELFAESQDRNLSDGIKIKNVDELIDFLEKTGW